MAETLLNGLTDDQDDDRPRPRLPIARRPRDEHRAERLVQEVRGDRAERDADRAAVIPRADDGESRPRALDLTPEHVERMSFDEPRLDAVQWAGLDAPALARPHRALCQLVGDARRHPAGVDC